MNNIKQQADSQSRIDSMTNTESDFIPCVQYGYQPEKGTYREEILRTVHDPVPEDAMTISPVYLLTTQEYSSQHASWRTNGYHVSGYTSIATKLQDQCEEDDRVFYPVYIESDEYLNEGAATVNEWYQQFTEEYLDIPFDDCTLYFSGGRSVHVHVPRFVVGDSQREHLKDLAKTFCEERDAVLDCGIYSSKRMFRLPGVDHHETGTPKIRIESDWTDDQISRRAETAVGDIPESYNALFKRVFGTASTIIQNQTSSSTHDIDDFVLEWELTETTDEGDDSDKSDGSKVNRSDHIGSEQSELNPYPEDSADQLEWLARYAKEFSPYALATGGARSVASIRIEGEPFCRNGVQIGNGHDPVAALVPAYFYGAKGCAGDEFTKHQEHAPLQLSKKDYKKWTKRDIQSNDHIVIIGGKNRGSIIHQIRPWQATELGYALMGEDGTRRKALDLLEAEGYDIGAAGKSSVKPLTAKLAKEKEKKSQTTHAATTTVSGEIFPARDNPQSLAERYQLQAEKDGIETLSYPELVSIACKHLHYGWQPTWNWFEEQFGSQFEPGNTWTHLRNIVTDEKFDEYDHIEVPPKPS